MRPAFPDGKGYARRGVWAFASLPVPAAAVFVWRESWWPLVLFVIWTVAAAVLYADSQRREHRAQSVRLARQANRSAIRTLSHHRHDWMNDLQILYGYLRLNRPEKAAEIVDRIRERMENDGKVSQLGNAELSNFVLSFRTVCDHMKLDVKVSDGVNLELVPSDPDALSAALISLINAVRYRAVASSCGENVLRVSLFLAGDRLHIELVYEGQWKSGQGMAEEAAGLLSGLGQLTEQEGLESAEAGSSWRMQFSFPVTAPAAGAVDCSGMQPPQRS